MGSTAISTGEALALTGAILGHSNPRSTAIYAHVQTDPSRRAANRVTKKIAAALAGNPVNGKQQKAGSRTGRGPAADSDLLRLLAQRLAENGPDAAHLRKMISDTVAPGRAEGRGCETT
jgi:hypothetical protein